MAKVHRAFREIVDLHAQRHPHADIQRIEAEARDYIRRVAGLGPDCRPVDDGGLEGVSNPDFARALFFARDASIDITKRARKKGS